MQAFELFNPVHVIFGAGEAKRIGSEAAKLGKKALLVSYQDHAFMKQILDNAVDSLHAADVEAVPCYNVTANPTLEQVAAGVEIARAESVDHVIAIGGGSAMDAAKLMAAGVDYPHDLWKLINSRHDSAVAIAPESALPLLMVPTLAATSSEMNCGAVVTNTETNEKSYLFHPLIYPKVSILDPELTTSLPAYQTACGAADAISHVMELYLNGVDDNPLQERIMESIVVTIMENTIPLLQDPGNVTLRAHQQWAACVAWNGWTLPGTNSGLPMHMIAHALSGRKGITHGATLAIIMVAWMRHTHQLRLDRYVQFAQRIFGMPVEGREPGAVAGDVIDRFEGFLKEIGVPTRMSECDITQADIDTLVEDTVRVYFGPDGTLGAWVPATAEDVRAVFELAL